MPPTSMDGRDGLIKQLAAKVNELGEVSHAFIGGRLTACSHAARYLHSDHFPFLETFSTRRLSCPPTE